jgi:hypothetical protein
MRNKIKLDLGGLVKISTKRLSADIRSNLEKLEKHLPARIQTVLEAFITEDLNRINEMPLFDILIHLLFQADKESAASIANLMVPLDTESVNQLDEWTVSNSAAFLRDYLKKDYVFYILKSKSDQTNI